jgi:hypothetical protein
MFKTKLSLILRCYAPCFESSILLLQTRQLPGRYSGALHLTPRKTDSHLKPAAAPQNICSSNSPALEQ